MRILVGCPVYKRDWILNRWVDRVLVAFGTVGLEPEFIFAGTKMDTTYDIALEATEGYRTLWVETDEPLSREDAHDWGNPGRIEHMVWLRNKLLSVVRQDEPDLFWSVDSDMLLHRLALRYSLDLIEPGHYAAVGSKAYLSSGRGHPNFANRNGRGGFERRDLDGPTVVDILMAIKLMDKRAYSVDYTYDPHGEDIGWSLAVKNKGLTCGWDGRITNWHVKSRDSLERPDKRVLNQPLEWL